MLAGACICVGMRGRAGRLGALGHRSCSWVCAQCKEHFALALALNMYSRKSKARLACTAGAAQRPTRLFGSSSRTSSFSPWATTLSRAVKICRSRSAPAPTGVGLELGTAGGSEWRPPWGAGCLLLCVQHTGRLT